MTDMPETAPPDMHRIWKPIIMIMQDSVGVKLQIFLRNTVRLRIFTAVEEKINFIYLPSWFSTKQYNFCSFCLLRVFWRFNFVILNFKCQSYRSIDLPSAVGDNTRIGAAAHHVGTASRTHATCKLEFEVYWHNCWIGSAHDWYPHLVGSIPCSAYIGITWHENLLL